MVLHWVPDSPQNPHRQGSWGSAQPFLCFGQSVPFHHTLLQSFLHSQYLSHSHSLHPLSSRIRRPCLPLALMLMHSQSGCPLSSRALHVHQARPKACMQISSNCSAVQTPWNLLWGRPWVNVSEMQGKKWAPAHLFYANENKKAKHYKGLSVS